MKKSENGFSGNNRKVNKLQQLKQEEEELIMRIENGLDLRLKCLA